ncbi:restriction endonuclease subunit S [Aliarcobacter butzleri]|uniref:restriction endonuclease subunit S n=1 Tax=Aliarcobacter butzleri TaxID=28197 RepID=UPI002B245F97|nr:restriction endonuclease subunit S [Aliarcobacter butzleri]
MIDNLPNGWKVEKLGNLVKRMHQGINTAADKVEFSNSGYPILQTKNISKGIIDFNDTKYMNNEYWEKYKEKYKPKTNDILLANIGTIGKNVIVKEESDYLIHWNIFLIEPNQTLITTNYLKSFFDKLYNQNYYDLFLKGGTVKFISKSFLIDLEIPIPPLQQQEKIVKVLDLTSNLIEKQKELLEKYDLFLKSKFIEMFGDPISNPMGWEVVKLDSLGKWQSGGTPSRAKPDFFKGNIDWYSAGELNQLYTIGSIEKITEEAIQKSSAKIFKENTLLIGMYDTAAFKMSILKKSSASNQAIANLDNDLKITNVLWLYFVFLAYKELYLNSRAGVRQQNLSLSKIKNFETILPPIELQNKFASIVEKIETIKEKENQKLKQMNDLHNSMMNKAFKGEIK